MSENKKIAIITGVTSFLGRSTARYLLSKGFIVFGIIRRESQNLDVIKDIDGLRLIQLDFDVLNLQDFSSIIYTDTMSLINKIRLSNLDITFIHFAWGATLDRNNFAKQMFNIDMSIKVLEFAKLIGANRFVFAGSQAEMSETPYGMAKKQFAEYAVNNLIRNEMSFIHFRIFSVYGKEDRETSLIKSLVKYCKENKDIALTSCKYNWNFLYINDFVKILYKFIDKDVKTGVYDIASDDTRLLKEYVMETRKVLGAKNKLNFGERPDSLETFAIPNIDDTLKAIGGFKFTKFADGICEV